VLHGAAYSSLFQKWLLFEEVFESSSEETPIPYFMDIICSAKTVCKEKLHEVKPVAAPLDSCAHLTFFTDHFSVEVGRGYKLCV
jgi:hypothetical protein